jgi:glutathione S-transferase
MKEPAHLAHHPFGQIPAYEDGELVPFETGAIVDEYPNLCAYVARGEARPA